MATWDVDLKTGDAIWSENHFRLIGIPVPPGRRASRDMWLTYVHPDDRERAQATFDRAMKERTLYSCEYRIVRADGQIIWVEPRGRFFYDGNRRAVRAVGVLFEITARKHAEERLIQRETQLDLAARIVGIGIFDHDHVNERLYWSDLLREIHEIGPDVPPHIGAYDGQVHPEDCESLAAAVKAAHDPAGDGKFSKEYRIVRRNGDIRWIVGRAQTFFAGEGAQRHAVRTVGAEYDVTDRKRIEMDLRSDRESLRRAEAALREADRRKDEFLATLAHELRNPLAPIRNAAHMLTLPKLDEEQLQWARRVIHRQVQHMARLLDDLLDVARITCGKLQLKKEHVDFGTIVDTAVEAARPLINAKKHGLTLELPPQIPTLEADPVRLAQVLSNLLTNAAKYTDESGRIALRAWVEDNRLRISVRDNGIGLSNTALPHMFQMFSQVHEDHDRSGGGLGIGLALVKGLVDLHGGTIEAHSDGPGRGSEFVVTIPVRDGGAPLAGDAASAPQAKTASARRILVADDNHDAADSLALLLEAHGHIVRTAHGGHSAVALAKDFQPDIALLDIGMPDMNGYEVAQQLRETQWGKTIRLIALTGWGQDEDKRRASAAGFDHHLTKPVELQELEALLLGMGGRSGSDR
jgi:signal transduction histidine kinase/ActR/RegA family two-component response regulator